MCGDFNVAPEDRDVWDPTQFVGATHVSQPERDALAHLESWGLVDVFRRLYDEDGLFSWWDYRGGSFHRHHGMRIDLILVTEVLAARTTYGLIDRNARKGEKPSDHTPVFIDTDARLGRTDLRSRARPGSRRSGGRRPSGAILADAGPSTPVPPRPATATAVARPVCPCPWRGARDHEQSRSRRRPGQGHVEQPPLLGTGARPTRRR